MVVEIESAKMEEALLAHRWRRDTDDGLERDFSFLFRTGGKLPVFNSPLGPRAPQAWLLRDKAPVTLACHPLFSLGADRPSQKGRRNLFLGRPL